MTVRVEIDRCFNNYKKTFICLSALGLAITVLILWYRALLQDDVVLNDKWKEQWSTNQKKLDAKKDTIFERGKDVKKSEIFLNDYLNSDVEEYGYDENYNAPSNLKHFDYNQNYYDDLESGLNRIVETGDLGAMPELNDYSIKGPLNSFFKGPLEKEIKFLEGYKNPCWAEFLPRRPYINNSFLKMEFYGKVLQQEFRYLRKLLASRQSKSTKWRIRCLPYYYIMETPPTFNYRLFDILGFHPSVVNPHISEPEFWNENGPSDKVKFRDYLDIYDGAAEELRINKTTLLKNEDGDKVEIHSLITGDGSNSYMWMFSDWKKNPNNKDLDEPRVTAASFIKSITPDAKFIIVLKNPTERLYDSYRASLGGKAFDKDKFHDIVGRAMEAFTKCLEKYSLRYCIYDTDFNRQLPVRLRIGMYYHFIEDWLKEFKKDQILILRYEDYVESPSKIINEICSHLEIEPFPSAQLEKLEGVIKTKENENRKERKNAMLSSTMAMLKHLYSCFNDRLAELLDDEKFKWSELAMDLNVVEAYLKKSQMNDNRVEQIRDEHQQQLEAIKRIQMQQQLQQQEQQKQLQSIIGSNKHYPLLTLQQADLQKMKQQFEEQQRQQQIRDQQEREKQEMERRKNEQMQREQKRKEKELWVKQQQESQKNKQMRKEQERKEKELWAQQQKERQRQLAQQQQQIEAEKSKQQQLAQQKAQQQAQQQQVQLQQQGQQQPEEQQKDQQQKQGQPQEQEQQQGQQQPQQEQGQQQQGQAQQGQKNLIIQPIMLFVVI